MIKNFYYIFNILGTFTLISTAALCMEEENPINYPRVQVFSLNKAATDPQSVHNEFEKTAALLPIVRHYPAFFLERTGEGVIYGQLACKDDEDAKSLLNILTGKSLEHGEIAVPVSITKGQLGVTTDKKLESLVRHYWNK